MKKSQMELMGIAIVMVLISLIFLFVVRFVILKPDTDVKSGYIYSALTDNFIDTLLETNVPECSNTNFNTLFLDCATNRDSGNWQNGGNIPCDNGGGSTIKSCEYIYDKVKYLLENTFDVWKMDYYFAATYNDKDFFDITPNETVIKTINKGCDNPTSRKGQVQPLPSSPPINIVLYICN